MRAVRLAIVTARASQMRLRCIGSGKRQGSIGTGSLRSAYDRPDHWDQQQERDQSAPVRGARREGTLIDKC